MLIADKVTAAAASLLMLEFYQLLVLASNYQIFQSRFDAIFMIQ